MGDSAFDFMSIIWVDLILSGDNALIIGLAASSLSAQQRRAAILFGLIAATVIRIGFAFTATYLMSVPGLLFVGGLALLWVSYRLYIEIRGDVAGAASAMDGDEGAPGSPRSLASALISITIADISMSIDNVLAVAAIARDDRVMLVFGLALSIAFMGLCATMILKLLVRYRWISYLGVAFLVFIGGEMIWDGRISAVGLIGIELASADPGSSAGLLQP